MKDHPKPRFDTPKQCVPGVTTGMNPIPDHGEYGYGDFLARRPFGETPMPELVIPIRPFDEDRSIAVPA